MKECHPSYFKVYDVLQALERLGPGMHSPAEITASCVRAVAEPGDTANEIGAAVSISKASVVRVLKAGRCRNYFAYDERHGRYGLPHWALETDEEEDRPRLPVAEAGPLTRVCRVLQRRTSQVVTAYALCLVDTPASRLMRHHDFGSRDDFSRDLDQSPEALAVLEHAPLRRPRDDQDAATLVLLAHLSTPKTPLMRLIRSEGHALTPSPLTGWQTLAAPLRHGSTVTGALSIHARDDQMNRHIDTYVGQLTNCAADFSEYVDHSSALAA